MNLSSESLSVVLSVSNAAASLAQPVGDLLEFLPDLTAKFEVLIVDTGSTDDTEEVAYELARQFPQVRFTRSRQSRGADSFMQFALEQTRGEMVIVLEHGARICPAELREMWELRDDKELILARPAGRKTAPSLIDRLKSWAQSLPQEIEETTAADGTHLLRRKNLQELPRPQQRHHLQRSRTRGVAM